MAIRSSSSALSAAGLPGPTRNKMLPPVRHFGGCFRSHCTGMWPPARCVSDCRGVRVRAEAGSKEAATTRVEEKEEEERSAADKLVDGMSFGQLCDDFQCISSPSVEATCRQLARDILEMRESNRALGTLAHFVKYKDPLRSFQGRLKYKRPSWASLSLQNPTVAVRQMEMMSTSVLRVQWTIRGRPKFTASWISPELIVKVTSTFTLNQISGQVLEHQEEWDVSSSALPAQAYFWISRLVYSTVEAGKDASELVQGVSNVLEKNLTDESNLYVDPNDPRKFFQVEDNRQKDIYQLGLVLALLYLVVQFLKLTL